MATLSWLGASLAQGIVMMALFVGAMWLGGVAGERWGKLFGLLVGIAALAAMIASFDSFHGTFGHAH